MIRKQQFNFTALTWNVTQKHLSHLKICNMSCISFVSFLGILSLTMLSFLNHLTHHPSVSHYHFLPLFFANKYSATFSHSSFLSNFQHPWVLLTHFEIWRIRFLCGSWPQIRMKLREYHISLLQGPHTFMTSKQANPVLGYSMPFSSVEHFLILWIINQVRMLAMACLFISRLMKFVERTGLMGWLAKSAC